MLSLTLSPSSKFQAPIQMSNVKCTPTNSNGSEGEDSTESNVRYAAYASRIRTIMMSAQRYVAYTSDIGESFRPVAHPYLVRGAYGVSWIYLSGDVAYEGYKAYLRNQSTLHPEYNLSPEGSASLRERAAELKNARKSIDARASSNDGQVATTARIPAIEDYRTVMAQRAVFQSVASMGLPALTIHSVVKYSGRALKDAKNKQIRTWAPIGLGMACVPFLPFVFDEPIEHATEWLFHNGFKFVGGPQAVGVAGQKELSTAEKPTRGGSDREL
ncbi:unnamed protein product [Periconia digitata]|uniref:Mitochondrial fission process protein 1 n=1 Tax=Periconia digitata TaxID=1303443 RepID=A0A9W4UMU8_9PLEO|nr:unnamed protein product [Periconia digitata]